MALARSASVPGGLSINTGAANLFGSNTASQPAAAGGLFGTAGAQTAQTTPAAKPGGLFGGGGLTVPAATTATTPSLFGSATATATTAAATPSLFGSTATAATTAATPSLFGAAAATTAAPAAATATTPAAGGLFGGAPKPAGGGLFGASAAAPAATAAPAGGGLFGAAAAAAPAPAAAATSQPSAFGGSLFGQTATAATATAAQPQAGTTVPGVRIDLSNVKGTTRFNDLHESLQKDIIAIDSLIQGYVEQKNQVAAFLPAHGESLAAIPGDVRFVARKYDGVAAALATDLEAIHVLRETVKQDANHAQRSFQALDNQKLPAQFHTSGLWSGGDKRGGNGGGGSGGGAGGSGSGKAGDSGDANGSGNGQAGGSDLISYFSRTGDDIGEQLRRLEKNLGEIEVHMYGVQSGLLEQLQRVASSSASAGSGGSSGQDGGSVSSEEKVAELAAVLREFEDSILTVASVVGTAREDMTALQLGRYLGGR